MKDDKLMLLEGLVRGILKKANGSEPTAEEVKPYVDEMRDSLSMMIDTAMEEIKELKLDVMKDDFDIGAPEEYPTFQAILIRQFVLAVKDSIVEALSEKEAELNKEKGGK